MNSGWFSRFLVVVSLTGLAAYSLYPTYYFFAQATEQQRDDNDKLCAALPTWMHCKKLNLGLDLQGGVHLVMGVRVEKAVQQRTDRLSDVLRDGLGEEKLAFARIDRPKDTADIVVELAEGTDPDKVLAYVRRDLSVLTMSRRVGTTLTLTLSDDEQARVREWAVEQAIKTIRNRADRLGVTEPTIAKRGADNVLIQLPGVKDPDRAIDIIGRTAQLEFTIVDTEGTAVFDDVAETTLPPGVVRQQGNLEGPGGKLLRDVYFELPESQQQAVAELLAPQIASDRKLAFGELDRRGVGTAERVATLRTYLLHSRPGITGDYLTDAQPVQDPQIPSSYYVTMDFDPKGAKIFEKLTSDNVQRQMAIVLDDKVNSAPTIQEKIGGGTARITLGGFGDPQRRFQEAKDLTLVLKAGALPAPVEIREKREVGKSLGQDAVQKGSLAAIIGGLLVVLAIALYYKGSGLIADFGLLLNLVFMMAVLATFEATLTLPGIAGIALTLSMAIDANVIIFERIREELRAGKTPRAAIEAGYDKAYSAIVDSNVTTLIAGVVLMQYGSGPVRGFAVTLIVGLTCSMFTAIFCTRLVYDFFTGRRRITSLSI
jgi:preprotein translocase subunit SecD